MFSWIHGLLHRSPSRRVQPALRRPRVRLQCEALEDRLTPSLTGAEFHVNTTTSNNQFQSANASSSNGMSVAVWTNRFSSVDTDIKAQLYSATGAKIGGEITVANSTRNEDQPAVTMDGFGYFVVAWSDHFSSSDSDIKAQRFTSTGAKRGSLITVANSVKNEYDASLAASSNGDFVVAYTLDFSAADQDVKAARYLDSGSLQGTFTVSSSSTARETNPSVARAPDGRFAIAYQTVGSTNDYDVILKRYSATASLVGTHNVGFSTKNEKNPSVSMDNSGNSVVAFEFYNPDADIQARRVTSAGVMGSVMTLKATTTPETNPVVALDRTNGKFVVGYLSGSSSTSAMVVEVSSANSILATLTVSSGASQPAISIDGDHFYFVTYTTLSSRTNDSGNGIFGRFGTL